MAEEPLEEELKKLERSFPGEKGDKIMSRSTPSFHFPQRYWSFSTCPADMEQQYLELYAEHMQDKFSFSLIEKNKDELVWEAYVRQGPSGCIQTSALSFSTASTIGYNSYVTNDAYKPADIYGDVNSGRENRFISGIQVTQNWLQERGAWTLCHLLLRHYDVDGAVEVAAKVLKAIDCQPQADKLLHGRASIPEFSVQVSESPLFAEKGQCRKTSPADSRKSVFCYQCPREDLPERIIPDVVWDSQRNHEIYSLCSLEAGSFQCYYTDLIFEVEAGVTITYHFDSWHKHLNGRDAQRLSVAGPLLNIQADPLEAVAAVHFPHFLCLADGDSSQVYIGHFVEEGMSLEKPSRVGSRHAVLRNPKFSPRGVVFKKPWFKRKMKVHCITLLYQVLEVPAQKFHLYLLPNDSSLRKTVHEKEEKCPSWRLDKPSVILKPLKIGSRFFVQKLDDVEICPKELELQYLHADMEQQYLELYAEHRQDKFHFNLIEKKRDELIWEAFVRQEASPPHPMSVSPKQHFIEQHREELIQRTSNVEAGNETTMKSKRDNRNSNCMAQLVLTLNGCDGEDPPQPSFGHLEGLGEEEFKKSKGKFIQFL
ncbi:Hypothetical predicted protein [Podarcis lilfordi]|uniref:FIIND domain-containing protein n=1 Tax=Podarcis lilfordi TaxID=74358 RepID=A0AA35L812_9SAUR|nr:Hypothetical predicted protein [Podarcis lilfordi]